MSASPRRLGSRLMAPGAMRGDKRRSRVDFLGMGLPAKAGSAFARDAASQAAHKPSNDAAVDLAGMHAREDVVDVPPAGQLAQRCGGHLGSPGQTPATPQIQSAANNGAAHGDAVQHHAGRCPAESRSGGGPTSDMVLPRRMHAAAQCRPWPDTAVTSATMGAADFPFFRNAAGIGVRRRSRSPWRSRRSASLSLAVHIHCRHVPGPSPGVLHRHMAQAADAPRSPPSRPVCVGHLDPL